MHLSAEQGGDRWTHAEHHAGVGHHARSFGAGEIVLHHGATDDHAGRRAYALQRARGDQHA